MPEATKTEAPKPAAEKKNEKEEDKSDLVISLVIPEFYF